MAEKKRSPSLPSVKARIDFLQAVANARGTESPRFKGWFPSLSNRSEFDQMWMFSDYGKSPDVWQHPLVPPFIFQRDDVHIYKETLRYKLRVLWHRVNPGDICGFAVDRLMCEMRASFLRHDERYFDIEKSNSFWFFKTMVALEWLKHNTHRFRICKIPDCHRFRYFIATPSRKTYCSDYCQDLAEVRRSEDNSRRLAEAKKAAALVQGTKEPRLSPEGRDRIVKAVNARWNKYRIEKHRLKNI